MALVGDPKRIALIAADPVAHFEKRVEAMNGKAMVVSMSRLIAVDPHNELVRQLSGPARRTVSVAKLSPYSGAVPIG